MDILKLYNPLLEILFCDDFDNGLNGWTAYAPNLQQDVMEYYPAQQRFTQVGPPMLSTMTYGLVGTYGSPAGTYSMKIATRPIAAPPDEMPVRGSTGQALKRFTLPRRQLLKFEMIFGIKVEQDRPGIGETDFRAFAFFWDIQDEQARYFIGVRYMNAAAGKLQQRWQYFKASEGRDEDWGEMGESAVGLDPGQKGARHKTFIKRGIDAHFSGKRTRDGGGEGFQDVPGGKQELCWNETNDKLNWHHFSLLIDTERREYVELRCADRVFDLRGLEPTLVEPYPRIRALLNSNVHVETDTNRRAFMYVDSAVLSTGPKE
ncbi:MAG TPA: DUF6772 family protein [Spirochaetia bacterium]|nr:DUF6772 family protein [Spirochaetia bacterium]